MGEISRRRVLQAGAAAAAGAAVGPTLWTQNASAQGAFGTPGPPGQVKKRPNFLFLTCDQNRYPPVYESPQVRAYRRRYLRTQNALMANGMNFTQYYCATAACMPARTTIYTGQYPSLHGNTQTVGAAKSDFDPDVFWLTQYTVPTIGNYFRAGGYNTIYKGKGHFASNYTPLEPGTKTGLLSFDPTTGIPDPTREQLYIEQNLLDPFGWDGWVGPEPHGSNPFNSGSSAPPASPLSPSGRDQIYADEAVNIIKSLDANRSDQRPWFLVASFVNPHDIATVGVSSWLSARISEGHQSACTDLPDFTFNVDPAVPHKLFDDLLFEPSLTQDLTPLPEAQVSYRDAYHEFITGIPDIPHYLRLYYQLLRNVDDQMWKVYTALKQSRFMDDTIVVFWSDHGELLSAHGDMHEKWHQSYQESVHIPLMISNPKLFPTGKSIDALVSQVDLLPTLLGLAGLEEEPLRETMTKFTDPQPLVGRDLSDVVLGNKSPTDVHDPIYFYTEDEISSGLDQDNWYGFPYESVVQPNNVETVLTYLDGSLWRLTRYYENPQYWSQPGTASCAKNVVNSQLTTDRGEGVYELSVTQTVTTTPASDQWEMYNVSSDPTELNNLYGITDYSGTQRVLTDLLQHQASTKRLQPGVPHPWASGVPGAPYGD
jgi:choline-sulfatase